MNIIPATQRPRQNGYPTSDGKPMAETEWHRILMTNLIATLSRFFAQSPRVHVSGNLLLFDEQGNRRRHVSPDVFVVRGVGKHLRENYLVWEEGRAPQFVIELTSSSTRREDQTTKRALYQDTLRVREYFLFDPLGDYLDPPLQGYRLRQGTYRPIRPVENRLPSQVVGLHLERAGQDLRLWNPLDQAWLPTPDEERQAAEARAEQAEVARQTALERAEQAEAELARLRQELEELRRSVQDQKET
jgi:Uma2 family endonuclease